MKKWIEIVIGVVLLCVIAGVGYRLAVSKVEIDIYRDRLVDLSNDYESLRSMYNEAVAKTAVTEVRVKEGRLSVVIRTIQGVERVIDTPYDPGREIFFDYVVREGRLWIRRVYDGHTPPINGLLIDDSLREVDWEGAPHAYGSVIYRPLSEGRWVITVTGDGSLGLGKVGPEFAVVLSGPPPVRDYEQVKKQIDERLSDVTAGEIIKRLIAPGK